MRCFSIHIEPAPSIHPTHFAILRVCVCTGGPDAYSKTEDEVADNIWVFLQVHDETQLHTHLWASASACRQAFACFFF